MILAQLGWSGADVIRIGSNVEFEIDDGRSRKVQLVFPKDADINAGKISVLTPVGTLAVSSTPRAETRPPCSYGQDPALILEKTFEEIEGYDCSLSRVNPRFGRVALIFEAEDIGNHIAQVVRLEDDIGHSRV